MSSGSFDRRLFVADRKGFCLRQYPAQAFEVAGHSVTLNTDAREPIFGLGHHGGCAFFCVAQQGRGTRFGVFEHRPSRRVGVGANGLCLVFRRAVEGFGLGARRARSLLRRRQLRGRFVEVALRLHDGLLLAGQVLPLCFVASRGEFNVKVDARLLSLASEPRAVLVVFVLQLSAQGDCLISKDAALTFGVALECRALSGGLLVVGGSLCGDLALGRGTSVGNLALGRCAGVGDLVLHGSASAREFFGECGARSLELELE